MKTKKLQTILRPWAAMMLLSATAGAQAEVRIGFMAPMTGPLGITGQEMRRGLDLALAHLGGRVGGQETIVVAANDQANPNTAVAELSRLVEKEHVDVLIGIAASNVAAAIAQPSIKVNLTVLLAHAGPAELAGKGCSENIFSIGHQNEQPSEALGQYLKEKGVKRLYGMGMDYRAGWEMVEAVQNGLGTPLVGKIYTAFSQVDFAPELARVRQAKPDALFVFYPGYPAVAFMRQYAGSGLKSEVPLYSVGALTDSLVLKAQGDTSEGVVTANTWNAGINNPQNRRLTDEFKAKNGGREPTTFSAQTYDTVMYLDAALRQTQGSTEPKALRAALRNNSGFKSVRGNFRLNKNQFPIQDIVIQQVAKDGKGSYYQKVLATIPAVADRFAAECVLK